MYDKCWTKCCRYSGYSTTKDPSSISQMYTLHSRPFPGQKLFIVSPGNASLVCLYLETLKTTDIVIQLSPTYICYMRDQDLYSRNIRTPKNS